MVIWTEWLESASTALGVTTSEGGIILSLAFVMSVVLAIAIATRGHRILESSSLVILLGLILFTYMGWLPLWTGSALALVTALFIAKYVGDWF
jgi:hypothetical protein